MSKFYQPVSADICSHAIAHQGYASEATSHIHTLTMTIYLISGASRGIGLALVSNILKKHSDAFVYAGARNPDKAIALKELEGKYPGRLTIILCVSADVEGNVALAKEIERHHGRVDTVIANAAISEDYGTVFETPLSTMEEHFRINVLGPLSLFQAIFSLLKKSTTPRFISISSAVGSLVGPVVKHANIGFTPYGSSKAALNWVTRKIHFENEWLITFPLTPGPVTTDMLLDSVTKDESGLMKPWVSVAAEPDQAGADLLEVIDNSTREVHGGQFYTRTGGKVDW